MVLFIIYYINQTLYVDELYLNILFKLKDGRDESPYNLQYPYWIRCLGTWSPSGPLSLCPALQALVAYLLPLGLGWLMLPQCVALCPPCPLGPLAYKEYGWIAAIFLCHVTGQHLCCPVHLSSLSHKNRYIQYIYLAFHWQLSGAHALLAHNWLYMLSSIAAFTHMYLALGTGIWDRSVLEQVGYLCTAG